MLKRIISAAFALTACVAFTTNAYAADSVLNSICAGAGKKISLAGDSYTEIDTESVKVENGSDKNSSEATKDTSSDAMIVIYPEKSEEENPMPIAGEAVKEENSVSAETEEAEGSDEEEDYGDYCVADVDDLMNVRIEPSEDASIAGYMYKDCVGEILDRKDGWTKIRSGNLEGWAKDDYLLFGEEAKEKTEGATMIVAVINADLLRIRAEASEDAEVKAMLSSGDEVEVIEDEGDDWTKISFEDGTEGEGTGYVSSEYISLKTVYKSGETKAEVEDREKKSKAAREEAENKDKDEKKKDMPKAEDEDKKPSAPAKAADEDDDNNDSSDSSSSESNSAAVSADDETLLAALIQCECNGPYDAQLAVGSVVVNRAKFGYGSISNAIYAPGQFGPASSGKLNLTLSTGAISASARQAAKDALSGISNVGNARYFRNVKSGHEGIVIGNHVYW